MTKWKHHKYSHIGPHIEIYSAVHQNSQHQQKRLSFKEKRLLAIKQIQRFILRYRIRRKYLKLLYYLKQLNFTTQSFIQYYVKLIRSVRKWRNYSLVYNPINFTISFDNLLFYIKLHYNLYRTFSRLSHGGMEIYDDELQLMCLQTDLYITQEEIANCIDKLYEFNQKRSSSGRLRFDETLKIVFYFNPPKDAQLTRDLLRIRQNLNSNYLKDQQIRKETNFEKFWNLVTKIEKKKIC
ncbi:hypothetical protein SNEBB_010809 [Seison nebaliae]|nr:hypothetical protein SNEBB_010809 [Seison nebaliae]